jgi:uroporphyrinogen-III synthase
MSTASRPLAGRRVATTRDTPGRLDSALAALGADVVHVPLIEIVEPIDGGAALAGALAEVERYDWVVVTSRHGAVRVAAAVGGVPGVRTAAVGRTTEAALRARIARDVDVVPARHTAADLVAAMPEPGRAGRALVALADRAAPTLVDGLRGRGYEVDAVVAYRTRLRRPSPAESAALRSVDAVTFASGSAAEAWAVAIGAWVPPAVVAIGPTTAEAARQAGLAVTAVAADQTTDGLAAAVVAALRSGL